MARLPIVSGKEVIKILSKLGFFADRQKGSHVIMKKKTSEKILITVVPLHKKLDPGTLLAILKQTEISREEFEKML